MKRKNHGGHSNDSDNDDGSVGISTIPEPSAYASLLGLAAFAFVVWSRKSNARELA